MNGRTRTWIGVLTVAAAGLGGLDGGVGGVTRGDIIELKDGSKIAGTMVRKDQVMVITRDGPGGGTMTVAPDDVVRVTLTGSLTPAEKAESDWTRTQFDLRRTDKFAEFMGLLEKFAAGHVGTPAGDHAQKLAAMYGEISGQDPIKFRSGWMPRAQVEVMQKEAEAKAKPAVAAYKAGRLSDALEAAKDALAIDEGNATALAITGLVNYRQNRLQDSRTAFLKLVDSTPNSVLGWNNLGVVAFGLKRELEGLGFYTKALQAAPENRLLLDNIVEAMHAYSGNKLAPAYKDLERQFAQAETAMEAQAARRGMFRYGSTWVTQEQRDRLVLNRQTLDKNKSALEGQYDQAVRAAEALAAQIKQAQADYEGAANDANYWASQMVIYTPGGSYIDGWAQARRDASIIELERARKKKVALEDQRAQLATAVKQMYADAQKIKGEMAKAEGEGITGVQRLMELGDEVPPPAAVALPPKDVPAPAAPAVVIPKVDVGPVQDTERPVYPDNTGGGYGWLYPVNPFPGVVVPPVMVVPPGQKGPIIMPPGGGPVIVVPAPAAPAPVPAPVTPKPRTFEDGSRM